MRYLTVLYIRKDDGIKVNTNWHETKREAIEDAHNYFDCKNVIRIDIERTEKILTLK